MGLLRPLVVAFMATAVVLVPQGASAKEDSKVAALFPIRLMRLRISAATLEALTSYTASKVTEKTRYKLVPQSAAKRRLSLEKRTSYKSCYDEKCQIELGRELAAEKTISIGITKVGKLCLVVATVFDLKTAIAETSSSETGSCSLKGLFQSIDRVVGALGGRGNESLPDRESVSARPVSIDARNEALQRMGMHSGCKEFLKPKPTIVSQNKYVITLRATNVAWQMSKHDREALLGFAMTLWDWCKTGRRRWVRYIDPQGKWVQSCRFSNTKARSGPDAYTCRSSD
jgi:hypothetical protein